MRNIREWKDFEGNQCLGIEVNLKDNRDRNAENKEVNKSPNVGSQQYGHDSV